MRRHLSVLLALGVALGSSASAQSNDAPRNNGGDVMYLYSSPSVGVPAGTLPPDLQGDLYWTAHAGQDQLANVDASGLAQMEISGYYESIYDTDWTTSPWFYTRVHGPALASGGSLQPSFFQFGLTSEVIVSLGPTGFGNPCTVAPSICTGGCFPPSYQAWLVDIQLGTLPGSGVMVSALGTSASDFATTWFVHGGMDSSSGPCGTGDYTLQDVHSTDETGADPSGSGLSPWGGFQIAGGGPSAEGVASTVEGTVTWRNPILNPVADSGTGFGLEKSPNGGGAQNGFLLVVSGGGARLAVELRDQHGAGVAFAFAGASLTPLSLPGVAVFGAHVLVVPDALFTSTFQAWQGSVVPVVFEFPPEGAFQTVSFAVPPSVSGATLYLQGLTVDPATLGARTTNRVRVRLF